MFNSVTLVGSVGRDPQIRTSAGGKTMASFSLATSEFYTDRDGARQKRTQWHNIVAWGKLAELVDRFLQKGSMVMVEGKINYREWEGEDGRKHQKTEILAGQLIFLSRTKNGGASASEDLGAGDLPF